MNVGPATTAMLIRGVDQLDITDVVFTGIQTGPKIGGTTSDIVKSVAITRSKFNGIQIGGVLIQNTDRLIVESSEFNEMCVGRSVACGLRILDSRNFMIRNSKSIGSEMGFHLESSTGSIENCEVSNTKRAVVEVSTSRIQLLEHVSSPSLEIMHQVVLDSIVMVVPSTCFPERSKETLQHKLVVLVNATMIVHSLQIKLLFVTTRKLPRPNVADSNLLKIHIVFHPFLQIWTDLWVNIPFVMTRIKNWTSRTRNV
jgi:hypothetical protein